MGAGFAGDPLDDEGERGHCFWSKFGTSTPFGVSFRRRREKLVVLAVLFSSLRISTVSSPPAEETLELLPWRASSSFGSEQEGMRAIAPCCRCDNISTSVFSIRVCSQAQGAIICRKIWEQDGHHHGDADLDPCRGG